MTAAFDKYRLIFNNVEKLGRVWSIRKYIN